MASSARVQNLTANSEVKIGQARRWVESGVFAWVEVGVSIRKLSVAEMAAERSRLSQELEPFPRVELRGLVTRGIEDVRHEFNVAWQGTLFADPSLVEKLGMAGNA